LKSVPLSSSIPHPPPWVHCECDYCPKPIRTLTARQTSRPTHFLIHDHCTPVVLPAFDALCWQPMQPRQESSRLVVRTVKSRSASPSRGPGDIVAEASKQACRAPTAAEGHGRRSSRKITAEVLRRAFGGSLGAKARDTSLWRDGADERAGASKGWLKRREKERGNVGLSTRIPAIHACAGLPEQGQYL